MRWFNECGSLDSGAWENFMKEEIQKYIEDCLNQSINCKEHFVNQHSEDLAIVADEIAYAFKTCRKVLICGNGGSAADAQHMAAEFTGRFMKERKALPAIALTTDTSALTAIGNDYGYEEVFSRQIEALGEEGDILIAISTSGNSPNVLNAVNTALEKQMFVVSLTGGSGGKLAQISDIDLNVELGQNSARIQETHIFAIHTIVDLVERYFLE